MFLKKQIPNILTLSNLISGCLATYYAFQGELITASYLILAGAFFDFFDGLSARLLNVSGPLGKELDSLADVITFGMAPAGIGFMLLQNTGIDTENIPLGSVVKFSAFIMVAFSAYRLAKFNIDERQNDSFIGVPTPANALFWLSLPLIINTSHDRPLPANVASGIGDFVANPYILIALFVLMSLLLVAELPLLSLKFKSLKMKGNEYRYILIGGSIILLLVFSFVAIPFILFLYLILSIIKNLAQKQNELQSRN